MKRILTALTGAILGATLLGNARAQCMGDCDGNGAVVVNELITCVNVGLDQLTLDRCAACDGSGDSKVAVNELITSVGIALGLQPCSEETGTPIATPPPTPTATPGSTELTNCCVPAYYVWACESRTVAQCADLGGIDKGSEQCSPTLCGDLPPKDGHGICCLPNAAGDEIECEDRTASVCAAAGGVVKATGGACTAETCADVIPPNPDVRCCLPNPAGSEIECEDRTASACAAAGGVNKGAGVCAPDTCADLAPPSIQCCVPRHSGTVIECEDLTAEACDARGGVTMGAGSCTPDPCNP